MCPPAESRYSYLWLLALQLFLPYRRLQPCIFSVGHELYIRAPRAQELGAICTAAAYGGVAHEQPSARSRSSHSSRHPSSCRRNKLAKLEHSPSAAMDAQNRARFGSLLTTVDAGIQPASVVFACERTATTDDAEEAAHPCPEIQSLHSSTVALQTPSRVQQIHMACQQALSCCTCILPPRPRS